jgi:hypothetical protein
MKKLFIFALLAILVSCKKDDNVKPELPKVCEMYSFKERRVTNTKTGVMGAWERDYEAPKFYSRNCEDEGKILPGSTYWPSGQILEYRYVIRKK